MSDNEIGDELGYRSNSIICSLVDILTIVRRQKAVSRSELAECTGLSRSAVSQRVTQLLDAGLLVEGAVGGFTGGRRSRLLRLNNDYGQLLGVDLGATSVLIGLFDLSGTLLVSTEHSVDLAHGPEQVLGEIVQDVKELLRAHQCQRLVGVGVGVPGPVDQEAGMVESPPIMPGWHQFPIAHWLQQRLGCPVLIDNDVNVMALGERVVRKHDAEDFVFVKVGTGIGAGIILGGRLHRGKDGCAGDIGHIAVTELDIRCTCGRTGCVEALASGAAIAKIAEERARSGDPTFLSKVLVENGALTAVDVGEAARRGDHVAIEIIQGSARYLGQAIATVVNCLNPSLVVLGGGVLNIGDSYLAAVREYVYKRSLPLATRQLRIQPSLAGEMAGVIGAGSLVLEHTFNCETLAKIIV